MLQKDIAKILLNSGAVVLNPREPFTYASGIKSPIYCDNRTLISLPKERAEIVNGFLFLINTFKFDFNVVAGTSTAGIPWAAWLADKLGKPLVYVRAEAKGHGKGNQVEGQIRPGQKVLLIEDLVSTGGSSIKSVEALKAAQMHIVACLAIFTYQMKAAISAFNAAGVKLHTLSDFHTLIAVAGDLKLVNEKDRAVALEWNEDPSTWGARHGFK